MRIAQVTATFPPYWAGTGNVAYHNARLMQERGHDVTVFTTVAREAELDFPFRVERLPSLVRMGNAALTPGLIGRLRGFDVIHLHYPHIFGAELTLAAAKRYRTPLLVTYHNDLLADGLRGALFRAYTALNQRLVLSGVSRVIATSQDYAEHSRLARAKRLPGVTVVPNGVDTGVFGPSAAQRSTVVDELRLPEGAFVALFVGGLDRAHHFKGLDILIEAVGAVEGSAAVIVGDGELRASYEERASRIAPNRVHFMGRVALERLVDLYRGADVTVLPSVTMGEAFGMVLIESMACGTPVVATDLPGVRTVVDNGVDGIIVAPGDAQAIAGALSDLMNGREKSTTMGRAGREKVLRRYRWELIGDKLEALYHEVVSAS